MNTNSPTKRRQKPSVSDSEPPCKRIRVVEQQQGHAWHLAQLCTLKPTHGSAETRHRSTTKTTQAAPALKKVCAVTGSRSDDIQTCYIMHRDTPPDVIEQLEEIWGLKRHSLDLDHLSNLIQLTPALAGAFEAGDWALVPSDSDLISSLQDMEVGKNGVKDVFDIYAGKTVFTYNVVPLLGCTVDFSPDGSSPGSTSAYVPPYKKLPQLDLPIYPHLVVINIATRFRKYNLLDKVLATSWMEENAPSLIYCVTECQEVYPQWAPTREFDHEYAHLPRVDRFINRLVSPRDSLSRVLSDMDEDGGEDEDEGDEDAKCNSFSQAETYTQFRNRINIWIDRVRGAKVQCDPEHCPPETPSGSPSGSPPSSPLAASSSGSSSGSSAAKSQQQP